MPRLYRLAARAVLACVLPLSLSACDSGGEADGGGNGADIALNGSAFAFDATAVGGSLLIYLFDRTISTDAADSYRGDLLTLAVEASAPGTYTVGGAGGSTFGLYGDDVAFGAADDDPASVFTTTSGSITISSVSATQIRGAYDVRLVGVGGTRTARGSFTAQVLDEDPDSGTGGSLDVVLGGSAYAYLSDEGPGAVNFLELYVFSEVVAEQDIQAFRGDILFVILLDQDGPVQPGTYSTSTLASTAVYGEDATFRQMDDDIDPSEGTYFNTGGSITIESISDTEMRGSYTYTFADETGGSRRSTSGSFVASLLDEQP